MRSTQIIKNCSSILCTCLHHMVILRTRNKITDFFMILAWASPFKVPIGILDIVDEQTTDNAPWQKLIWALTEWAKIRGCDLLSCIVVYLELKDVSFFLHQTKNFLNIGPSEYIWIKDLLNIEPSKYRTFWTNIFWTSGLLNIGPSEYRTFWT